jgi:DNA-binding MarR family transcriptional regulator
MTLVSSTEWVMQQARIRPDVEVLAAVALIEQRVGLALERMLPHGRTAAQFTVLSHLEGSATPLTPGMLAKAAGVTGGAMTGALHKLQAAGLVVATADAADGRRKWIGLTPEGLAAHRACVVAARAPREALRHAFAAREFEQALPFLRRLAAFLEPDSGARPRGV